MNSTSIRRRLGLLLAVPLVVLLIVSAFFSYRVAVDAARDAYDRSLLDPAIALSRFVRFDATKPPELDLPEAALDALRIDSSDRMFYRILGPDGAVIAANSNLSAPPRPAPGETHVFYDILGTERLRAVALFVGSKQGEFIVNVAETTVKRNALVREVLIATVVPEALVILTAVVLLSIGIRLGLAPLERLREEIAKRSPADLRPVADADAPREVQPLLASLNQLLGRMRGTLDSQQQFIGNAAHQLRTPLAGLSAHAELALRESSSGELRRLLETLHGETRRTTHLVNQLLVLARAEPRGGSEAERTPVNLPDVVNMAASEGVQRALVRNIDLGFDLASAWTLGEPLLLRELVANLLDNAIDYTPKGGSVTIRTRAITNERVCVLEVEDDGPGIAPDLRQKVFERFYRVPATPAEGCGLGLAIVRDIAVRHLATVAIESGAGGRGTLVRVTLPRLVIEEPTGAAARGAGLSQSTA